MPDKDPLGRLDQRFDLLWERMEQTDKRQTERFEAMNRCVDDLALIINVRFEARQRRLDDLAPAMNSYVTDVRHRLSDLSGQFICLEAHVEARLTTAETSRTSVRTRVEQKTSTRIINVWMSIALACLTLVSGVVTMIIT